MRVHILALDGVFDTGLAIVYGLVIGDHFIDVVSGPKVEGHIRTPDFCGSIG
jgi:hypothetical protein